MGRGTGSSRKGVSKIDRYGGSRMSAVTPQTAAPTAGAKARPAKSTKKAAAKKAAPKRSTKSAGAKAAPKRSTKSRGSNKTQNRTASRMKVTAKE